ncbi:hypothetical protein N7535_004224 [Penicillium sp. DV-2018c]|nr:hypothetical protein N7461_000070 [Penicillium sp. DV-2018c]KAJ5577298.1 hypothetical protein N7535_004224 [Penicillium sp. DV-2018c]
MGGFYPPGDPEVGDGGHVPADTLPRQLGLAQRESGCRDPLCGFGVSTAALTLLQEREGAWLRSQYRRRSIASGRRIPKEVGLGEGEAGGAP